MTEQTGSLLRKRSPSLYTFSMTIKSKTIKGCGSKTAKCCGITDAQEEHLRDLVGQVAGKWSLWVLHVLYENNAPLRFARLLERVGGVSQKMLTQTLRQLERDGLITRTIFPEVPPRVEYELTVDGREMMEQFLPFWMWLAGRLPRYEMARARFDGVEE